MSGCRAVGGRERSLDPEEPYRKDPYRHPSRKALGFFGVSGKT